MNPELRIPVTQKTNAPTIQTPMNTQQIHGSSTIQQIQSIRATPELTTLIQTIVENTIITRNNNTPLVDEQITDLTNLDGLHKTSDLVKAIRDFSGKRSEYIEWMKNVDRIFELYGHLRGTAKYFGILSVITTKIIGYANAVLTSHNIPLNWQAIKQCLNNHYADKRDIGTLEYQLISMIQGRDNVETFYEKIYGHLTPILNNISGMELEKTAENILIDSYRNKALDTFIRGLNDDLPRLLSIREPKDLPEALSLCIKLDNQSYRSNYAQNNYTNYRSSNLNQYKITPPLPPRMSRINQSNYSNRPGISNYIPNNNSNFLYQNNRQLIPNSNPNFQYNKQSLPNNNNRYLPHQNYTQAAPPRPTAPKPQSPPEPMDVDQSIRTQHINYAN